MSTPHPVRPPLVTDATRLGFALLWLALVLDAGLFAPEARPDQQAWVIDLLLGRWSHTDPFVVAHFYLMGIWPTLLMMQLAPGLHRRPVPLWPFCLSAYVVGAFGLVPGIVVGGRSREPRRWQQLLAHPAIAVALLVPSCLLVGWAVIAGDLSVWSQAVRTDQFVHVMTADFAVLWAVSLGLALNADRRSGWWAVVPILGTVIHLCVRKSNAAG